MAPALKSRFLWGDLFVYYLSFGAFAFSAIVGSVLSIRNIGPRITSASVFALLLAGPAYSFVLTGGEEVALMVTIMLNTAVGIIIVVYPWNEDSLNSLLQALAICGSIISINTMLFYGSDDALLDLQSEDIAIDYLTTTFAMGVGVICATYFLIKNFSLFSIAVFGINWLGIALGRGRGAFLFCVLVAILYLIVAMNSRIAQFGRQKKILMFVLILSFIPIIFQQIMKMSRMRDGLAQILFSPDLEAEEGGRGSAFSYGMDQFYQHPILGNGLGAYANDLHLHPHNFIVSWAVDSGLIGVLFLTLFFLLIAVKFSRSVSLSNELNINIVYAMGALCAYMFLNFLKSYDPYQSRELYIMTALPVATYLVVAKRQWHVKKRSRRQRRNVHRTSSARSRR